MKTIAIIPAFGIYKTAGLTNLLGKSLFTWTIEQAFRSKYISEVYLLTDDEAIATIDFGKNVKVINTFTSIAKEAVRFTLNHFKATNTLPEIIACLPTTTPLRKLHDVDNCINQFINAKDDSLVSVSKISNYGIWEEVGGSWKKESREDIYAENASITVFKPETFFKFDMPVAGKVGIYQFDSWQSWQLDAPDKLDLFEYLFRAKRNELFPIGSVPKEKLKLIVYDFDGIMTNNKASIDQFGNESADINRSDGLAIGMLKKKGIQQVFLSAETNPIVLRRAEKLGIDCIYGIETKIHSLIEYLEKNNIKPENAAYFGNEINDLECMKTVAYSIAPADAAKEIKNIATLITTAKGGEGVVREFLDFLN